jgi:hypothetical protein
MADTNTNTNTDTTDQQQQQQQQQQQHDVNDYIYYFAIGSMMHPGSCEMRHFYPQQHYSEPAELMNYKLNFFSPMGVAEAVRAPGRSMHGVLHRVTQAQMVELDHMEVGYIRSMGVVKLYHQTLLPVTTSAAAAVVLRGDASSAVSTTSTSTTSSSSMSKAVVLVNACVYCRPDGTDTSDVDQPPRQRYLEILLAGAKHWGVDGAYVRMLEDHPFQPRTKPGEFMSLGSPPPRPDNNNDNDDRGGEVVVMEQVPDGDDDKIYFSLNGKIIEYSHPKDHKMYNIFRFLRGKYGPHLEVGMAHALYDMKYGVPNCLEQFTKEHSGYIEDNSARYHQLQVSQQESSNEHQYVQVIAKYPQTWKEEEAEFG